jgi:hypothetical protein
MQILLPYRMDNSGSVRAYYAMEGAPLFDVVEGRGIELWVHGLPSNRWHPPSLVFGRSSVTLRHVGESWERASGTNLSSGLWYKKTLPEFPSDAGEVTAEVYYAERFLRINFKRLPILSYTEVRDPPPLPETRYRWLIEVLRGGNMGDSFSLVTHVFVGEHLLEPPPPSPRPGPPEGQAPAGGSRFERIE